SCPREREQPAELDLRLYLGSAGLPEADLAAGQRVSPGVYLGTPRSARQLLYVTGGDVRHVGRVHRHTVIGPQSGPRGRLPMLLNSWWGARGSNPEPTD